MNMTKIQAGKALDLKGNIPKSQLCNLVPDFKKQENTTEIQID